MKETSRSRERQPPRRPGRQLERSAPLAFLALSIGYGAIALRIEENVLGSAPFDARTFPLLLAAAGTALSTALLLKPGQVSRDRGERLDWTPLLLLCLWMGGYALTLQRLGLLLSTALFLAGGFLLLGERRPLVLISLPLALAGVSYGVLTRGLGLYVPDPLLRLLFGS